MLISSSGVVGEVTKIHVEATHFLVLFWEEDLDMVDQVPLNTSVWSSVSLGCFVCGLDLEMESLSSRFCVLRRKGLNFILVGSDLDSPLHGYGSPGIQTGFSLDCVLTTF